MNLSDFQKGRMPAPKTGNAGMIREKIPAPLPVFSLPAPGFF